MSNRPEADKTLAELSAILLQLDLPAIEKRFEACMDLARLAHAEIARKVESAANAHRDYHARTDLEPEAVQRIVHEHESMHSSAPLDRAIENLEDAKEGVNALAQELHSIASKLQWSMRP